MASWVRVMAVLRSVMKSPRTLKGVALRRTVAPGIVGAGAIGTGLLCYYHYYTNCRTLSFAVHAEKDAKAAAPQLSARKLRFIRFASVVYEHEPYMTPRDFLFSVMLENVDRKLPSLLSVYFRSFTTHLLPCV